MAVESDTGVASCSVGFGRWVASLVVEFGIEVALAACHSPLWVGVEAEDQTESVHTGSGSKISSFLDGLKDNYRTLLLTTLSKNSDILL